MMRTIKYYIAIIAVLVLVSCKEERLSDDKMVEVIKDARLAYAIANNSQVDRDSVINVLLPKVFKLHGITEKEYYDNIEYLKTDIDRGLKIETEVAKKLKELKKTKVSKK